MKEALIWVRNNLVAIATITLAASTFYLVIVTRDVARQTRAAVEASVRPILVDARPGGGAGTIAYDRYVGSTGPQSQTFRITDMAGVDVRAFLDRKRVTEVA